MLINEQFADQNGAAEAPPGKIPLELKINGTNYDLSIEPRVSLLNVLREFIGLTGTKKTATRARAEPPAKFAYRYVIDVANSLRANCLTRVWG